MSERERECKREATRWIHVATSGHAREIQTQHVDGVSIFQIQLMVYRFFKFRHNTLMVYQHVDGVSILFSVLGETTDVERTRRCGSQGGAHSFSTAKHYEPRSVLRDNEET